MVVIMGIVFRENYVNFNQISDVTLLDINDVLVKNDIFIDLGDDSSNDWAGYSYWLCKYYNNSDEKLISSFVYVVTWFMTGNPIDINPNFKSNDYYKNDRIIDECLIIYNKLVDSYDDLKVEDLCESLIERIYNFYVNNYMKFIRKTERFNCVITYKDMELLDNVKGNNRTEKLLNLLHNNY